jgi:hypothetical protein
VTVISARRDEKLRARILERQPLRYSGRTDPALDRPDFVRAASSITRFADGLAVIQDDANFVALIDEAGVETVTLPTGDAGRRQFSDALGNKRFKLDLEAAFVAPTDSGEALFALGSGSTALREKIVEVSRLPLVRVHEATAFYAMLRDRRDFAPGQLNLEGAVMLGDASHLTLRLLARGNGAARDGLSAANATGDVSWTALLAHLRDSTLEPPNLERVRQYDLGGLGDAVLGFTDAAVVGGHLLYTASAEATTDAVLDAEVSGSAIGVFDTNGDLRWAPLEDANGQPLRVKAEGITASSRASEVLIVLDNDDTETPGELCHVALEGDWFAR